MDEHDTAQTDTTSPITHELEVAVSRARAWDAFVHGLDEWWPPSMTVFGSGIDRIEVEPHQGGRILEHSRDGREGPWGEVLESEPGERFVHTLDRAQDGDRTVVTVEFDDLPHGGTRVRVTHDGWNETNQAARAKHAAWPMLLDRYRAYAQHV